MIVFSYDKTFEGLLSAVFDMYDRKTVPQRLIGEGEPEPMFTERLCRIEINGKRTGCGPECRNDFPGKCAIC